MKYKTITLFLWIAVFVGIVSGCASTTTIPEYHPYVKSPNVTIKEVCEEILNTPEEKINIGKYALLLTKTVAPDLDVDYELKQLNDMANTVRPRLKDVTDPQKIVDILNDYFFKEMGFKSGSEEDPNTFWLMHYGRIRRSAHCVTIGVIYLCLTERLDLPVHGVLIPGIRGHFFVRYDNSRTKINIDTTYNSGKNISNEEYLKLIAPQIKDTDIAIKERMLSRPVAHSKVAQRLLKLQEYYLGCMWQIPGKEAQKVVRQRIRAQHHRQQEHRNNLIAPLVQWAEELQVFLMLQKA